MAGSGAGSPAPRPSHAAEVDGTVARLIAGMTMSLAGYVIDPAGGVERLYSDLGDLRGTDYMNAMIAETDAVLMGPGSFEMAPITTD